MRTYAFYRKERRLSGVALSIRSMQKGIAVLTLCRIFFTRLPKEASASENNVTRKIQHPRGNTFNAVCKMQLRWYYPLTVALAGRLKHTENEISFGDVWNWFIWVYKDWWYISSCIKGKYVSRDIYLVRLTNPLYVGHGKGWDKLWTGFR